MNGDPQLPVMPIADEGRQRLLAPIDWDALAPDELEDAWIELDAFVHRLRRTYNLPATVIPPLWHHHPELHMELSALHLAWLAAHAPSATATAPLTWHRDLADSITRLRDWTAQTGSRLDHDPGRQLTLWPGEPDQPPTPRTIHDRSADFAQYLAEQAGARTRRQETP